LQCIPKQQEQVTSKK